MFSVHSGKCGAGVPTQLQLKEFKRKVFDSNGEDTY